MKILFTVILIIQTSLLFSKEMISNFLIKTTPLKMMAISNHFEIVKKRADQSFEVYVPDNLKAIKLLFKLAPNAKLLEKNIHANISDKNFEGNQYRDFKKVELDLKNLAEVYKDFVELITYGNSPEGRPLYALKVNASKSIKPELMVTAATHGDELITVEVLFSLMDELLKGFNVENRITDILLNHTIYFIPVVSPDSFENRERYVQGIDPNRSYPWPENENNKPVSVIQSLINFSNQHKFVSSLDLHAYGKLIMYPWAFTTRPPSFQDETNMKNLVENMAVDNHYKNGQISKTIYIAKGSSADYYYWKNKTKAIAVEIGNEKIPNYRKIQSIINESREMIWTFLENK